MTQKNIDRSAYAKQIVFRSEESAKEYVDAHGGGWIHKLFDYNSIDFEQLNRSRCILKPTAQKRYYGWHVVLYNTVKFLKIFEKSMTPVFYK